MEEMREFRDKEAKITAIVKGDEFIKTEVLNKLQQAKSQIEHDVKAVKENSENLLDVVKLSSEIEDNGAKIRKRKMSPESEQQPRVKVLENKELKGNIKHKAEAKNDVKPYLYKNANYKKFYDNNARAHKPKTKFKNKKH